MFPNRLLVALLFLFSLHAHATHEGDLVSNKTASVSETTPPPLRFAVKGTSIIDRQTDQPAFFRGMGYSPYLQGETPLFGAAPADDGRYVEHVAKLVDLNVNYLHVFPLLMPKGFFTELDKTNLVYGQDIWVLGGAEDFLDPTFQTNTLTQIKAVIDHTYQVGRPDRLVLFSIGDELQAEAIIRTDTRHPLVRDFKGKHIAVTNRTATEVALAQLIDAAMEYELTTYKRRHLYCHTSWTHVGPLGKRDIQVPQLNMIVPDIGDLMCMNIYTYANGVKTSPHGSVTNTTYQGYLEELAASVNVPVLVTQVGLSTSPIEPKSWVPGFGGHRVADVPATFRSVWQDIHTAKGKEKFAGMVFFELHDEWWKSGENDTDSRTHEPEDPEEWFGVYGLDENNKLVPKGDIPQTVRTLFSAQ